MGLFRMRFQAFAWPFCTFVSWQCCAQRYLNKQAWPLLPVILDQCYGAPRPMGWMLSAGSPVGLCIRGSQALALTSTCQRGRLARGALDRAGAQWCWTPCPTHTPYGDMVVWMCLPFAAAVGWLTQRCLTVSLRLGHTRARCPVHEHDREEAVVGECCV